MKRTTVIGALVVAPSLLLAAAASQAAMTATYPSQTPVVNFDTYDFSQAGLVLIKDIFEKVSGDVVSGYYQSSVLAHLNSGSLVSAPGLNSVYELTVVAEFSETLTTVSFGAATYTINPGGTFTVYFDATPDSRLDTDSGFSDGTPIIQGQITGGQGSFFSLNPTKGFGITALNVSFTSMDPLIFSPTVPFGEAVFTTVYDVESGLTQGVSSVSGQSVVAGMDLLMEGDGRLTFIPLPASVWLLGSALFGVGVLGRRIRGVKAA